MQNKQQGKYKHLQPGDKVILEDGELSTRKVQPKNVHLGDYKVTKNETGSYLWAVITEEELQEIHNS